MPQHEQFKALILYILATVLGMTAIILPVIILGIRKYDHPWFPSARNGIETYTWYTCMFQILGGLVLGALVPKRPWRWGVAMGLAWPVLAIVLIATGPDINIPIPIALISYAFLSIPCVVGALLGAEIRKYMHW